MTRVEPSVYQMAINNVARYIRAHGADGHEPTEVVTAFEASTILSIAFCKSKEEVISDILRVGG
jgi:hypothetical protein